MHLLRLLRIFIPVLVIAAIVAGVIVVLTSRTELQSARRQMNAAWQPLRTELDTRYTVLAATDHSLKSIPGPLHRIVVQVESAANDWRGLRTNGGSVASQVTTANELEALGRRLVQAARAAPRLQGKPELATINSYASSAPPRGAITPFEAAVSRYERERNRPARRLAARILGYKSVPAYDAPGSA
ncbi:MAG: hypothetical protein QOG50_3349 [Actinomycetota bacterium]|jgi:hypothetical protein|nr:hypothetical protein [Actinomycetota bacterium]